MNAGEGIGATRPERTQRDLISVMTAGELNNLAAQAIKGSSYTELLKVHSELTARLAAIGSYEKSLSEVGAALIELDPDRGLDPEGGENG